jgi:hypothetical protein
MTANNTFESILKSHDARLSATFGQTVTPLQNTYGSYAEVMSAAAVSADAFGFWIHVQGLGANTFARDALITVAGDPAGGTAWDGNEIVEDLIVSDAAPTVNNTVGAGIEYYFPIKIESGTSLAVKASVNNATPGTMQVSIRLACEPDRVDLIRCGTAIRGYGATAASSNGTAVTAGSASEGAWTEIGTLADAIWYLTAGVGYSNASMASAPTAMDIAIGASTLSNRIVLSDVIITQSGFEQQTAFYPGAMVNGEVGEKIFARLQVAGAVTTNFSVIAYGVTGDAAGTGATLGAPASEEDPPVLGAVTPDRDEQPGSADAFSATWATAAVTPVTLVVSDVASNIAFVVVWARFAADEAGLAEATGEIVYAGRPNTDGAGGYRAPYTAHSTIVTTDPKAPALSIRRDSGWPGRGAVQQYMAIDYMAVDAAGNVLA